MIRTNLRLVFRVRGPNLVPAELTDATGVHPHRTFGVGAARMVRDQKLAGWDWGSAWAEDDEPLWRELMDLLVPHQTVFRRCVDRCVDRGATVALTIVGETVGELIETAGQAESLGWSTEGSHYPSLVGARVELLVPSDILAFLGTLDATLATYIDADVRSTGVRDG